MDIVEYCERVTNKKLSAWQKEMLLRHAEIINQQRRTPMDGKELEKGLWGDTWDWPRIPPLRIGGDLRPHHMNIPVWHLEEPKPPVEPVRVEVRNHIECFGRFGIVKQKPDILINGELATEELLRMVEKEEEPMESLRDKKIKSVTIECTDGKTYVGNVKRIEGNPYCIRECIVEVAVGNPVGKVGIKEVIFANPSTIVKWTDGTETVVSCMDNVKIIEKVVDGKKVKKKKPMKCDTYSKETGLAMAISKKFFGNEGSYNKIFKELCGVEE